MKFLSLVLPSLLLACATIAQAAQHQLRVRLRGGIMDVFLDGNKVTRLTSPGIAHRTKTKFGFTVNGSSIDFDNLKVRSTN